MPENLSSGFVNNTDADQPTHPSRLISTFVIRFLESIISKLATSGIPIFWLVSLAQETEPRFVGNLQDRFCHVEAHVINSIQPFKCTFYYIAHTVLFRLFTLHETSVNTDIV